MLAEEVARALDGPLLAMAHQVDDQGAAGPLRVRRCLRLRNSQLGDSHVGDIAHYIKRGVLWEAFEADVPGVVLIDEIDKRTSNFRTTCCASSIGWNRRLRDSAHDSSAASAACRHHVEQREELPDAFLRRCFFHHIRFPDRETMTRIVDVHFPGLEEDAPHRDARSLFRPAHARAQKKPSTSELLDSLEAPARRGYPPEAMQKLQQEGADSAAPR